MHERLYRTFLEDYRLISQELDEMGRSAFSAVGVATSEGEEPNGCSSTPLQCELHDPVIVLLTEMLKITPVCNNSIIFEIQCIKFMVCSESYNHNL